MSIQRNPTRHKIIELDTKELYTNSLGSCGGGWVHSSPFFIALEGQTYE